MNVAVTFDYGSIDERDDAVVITVSLSDHHLNLAKVLFKEDSDWHVKMRLFRSHEHGTPKGVLEVIPLDSGGTALLVFESPEAAQAYLASLIEEGE